MRFRTVGDISCTCPVLSSAKNPEEIILETASSSLSERGATRLDDQTNEASMERRKKEGTLKMKRHGLIRFITAGSVDDGKSTLIGRLLYDSKLVLTDQLHNLVNAKSSRASENEIDFSF